MASRRFQEKQLTNARVALTVDDQRHAAECNIFIESLGPPPKWHGRIWAVTPAASFKKGVTLTLTLHNGNTAAIVIQRPGVRGGYDFIGEGLPPTF
jgi:hypothetical protein